MYREFIFLTIAACLPRLKWADRLRPFLIRCCGAKVGRKCAWYDPMVIRPLGAVRNLTLGDKVFINSGVRFGCQSPIAIGNHVRIAANVSFETVSHGLDLDQSGKRGTWSDPIYVGDSAWIGAGATILPGVNIGQGAVVAAGAVVTHDVDAFTLVGGVPAKLIRNLESGGPQP
jgi:maltose O-acetyltransferase